MTSDDMDFIRAALEGFRAQHARTCEQIAKLERQLRGKLDAQSPRRTLSPEARRRIAAAQRKRWAEHKAKEAVNGK